MAAGALIGSVIAGEWGPDPSAVRTASAGGAGAMLWTTPAFLNLKLGGCLHRSSLVNFDFDFALFFFYVF